MKKVITLMITMSVLFGCTESNVTMLNDMTVKSKKENGINYSLTLEKEGHEIQLRMTSRNEYDALVIGSIVDVTYSDKYYIQDLTFPKLQSENVE